MSSGVGYPFTLNGNTYTQDMFAPWAYPANFPRAMGDLGAVGAQVAADRAAVKAAIDSSGNLLIPATQAKLEYVSATQLALRPFGGNFLWINGLNRLVPSAGVALANTGLAGETRYYLYAYMAGTTLTLEASTTTHAIGPAGVRIKGGDATRTLVGMVYTEAGTPGTFADSITKRLVASFYNQPPRDLTTSFQAYSTGSTSLIELGTAYRTSFVCWATDKIDLRVLGYVSNSTAGPDLVTYAGVDGAPYGVINQTYATAANRPHPVTAIAFGFLSEGYHVASPRGQVSSGTGTWNLSQVGAIG